MITIKNIKQRLNYIESILRLYEDEHQALTALAKVYDDPKYHDIKELVECVDQSTWAPPETKAPFVPAGGYKLVESTPPRQYRPRTQPSKKDQLAAEVLVYIKNNTPVVRTNWELAQKFNIKTLSLMNDALRSLVVKGYIMKSHSRPTTYEYLKGVDDDIL